MEMCSKNGEVCPQLLDLIPKDTEWLLRRDEEIRGHRSSEEKKLELRLGPPGDDWHVQGQVMKNGEKEDDSSIFFSLGYCNSSNNMSCAKRAFMGTVERNISGNKKTQKFCSSENTAAGAVSSSPWSQQKKAPFLQFPTSDPSLPVMTKESSQPCCSKLVDLQAAERKAFSPPPANTAVPNSSQKRIAPPVVGWPPVRSFRKKLTSNSTSKQALDSQNAVPDKVSSEKPEENCRKGLFVKINMDGVPIGRKVDLEAYDSYEQLSSAVDELFRVLLAAQKDSSVGVNKQCEKAITGLSDGNGEYTLVYEDNEGDRMLVGDVPWHMFVSSAKRLRVLKSSEISALSLGGNKQQEKLLLGMK